MQYEFSDESSSPLVMISLAAGEEVRIESGSMVFHNGKVVLEGRMNSNGSGGIGGIFRAAARSLVSGEGFFITTARGTAQDALLGISPGAVGQIRALDTGKMTWCINDGAFLACDSTVNYNMKRQSIGSALFGGTGGLFIMETSGSGTVLVNGFGSIVELELDGSDSLVVDNHHVVAWQSTLNYSIKAASGLFGFTTGEGLVNEFSGCGRLLIQTKNPSEFVGGLMPHIIPLLPKR